MKAAQLRAATAAVEAIASVVVEIPGDATGTVAIVVLDSWRVEYLIGAAQGEARSRLVLQGRMVRVEGPNAVSRGLTEVRVPAEPMGATQ